MKSKIPAPRCISRGRDLFYAGRQLFAVKLLSNELYITQKTQYMVFSFPNVYIMRFYWSKGFIVGKSSTSRMEAESVSSMTRRSTPKPRPPVGGRPYSRAVT